MSGHRTITTVEELEALPDGTVVRIRGSSEVLTMNRTGMTDPHFDCSDGGWLRCNNVFVFYGVDHVIAEHNVNPYRTQEAK